jgi:sec-independent protein translocase protein TatA
MYIRCHQRAMEELVMFEGLFQPFHLIVILVIALVIFAPGKLSEVGGSLGKAVRGFKKAMNEPAEGEGASNSRIVAKNDKTEWFSRIEGRPGDPGRDGGRK